MEESQNVSPAPESSAVPGPVAEPAEALQGYTVVTPTGERHLIEVRDQGVSPAQIESMLNNALLAKALGNLKSQELVERAGQLYRHPQFQIFLLSEGALLLAFFVFKSVMRARQLKKSGRQRFLSQMRFSLLSGGLQLIAMALILPVGFFLRDYIDFLAAFWAYIRAF